MAEWLILISGSIVLCFGFVIMRGAPFLPTLKKQQEEGLDMLALSQGETMLELGCGDGRILKAAAQRGWKVVGYELNPILAAIAWLNTLAYRGQVKVICGDFWRKDWPEAQGIFTFLLPKYMNKLDKKIIQYQQGLVKQDLLGTSAKRSSFKHKPVKLLSVAFIIKGRKPVQTRTGLYLYTYQE